MKKVGLIGKKVMSWGLVASLLVAPVSTNNCSAHDGNESQEMKTNFENGLSLDELIKKTTKLTGASFVAALAILKAVDGCTESSALNRTENVCETESNWKEILIEAAQFVGIFLGVGAATSGYSYLLFRYLMPFLGMNK